MRSPLNHIGKQVRRTIERTGMTTAAFAEATDVGYGWLTQLINAEQEPLWAENLRKVARKTGSSLDNLFRL